jgi:YVTN family beta-propeller protein
MATSPALLPRASSVVAMTALGATLFSACTGDPTRPDGDPAPPAQSPPAQPPATPSATAARPLTSIVATVRTKEPFLVWAAVSEQGYAYVTQLYTGMVHRIQLSDFSLTTTTPSEFIDMRGVVVDSRTGRVLAAGADVWGPPWYKSAVLVLDAEAQPLEQRYETTNFDDEPLALALSTDGRTLYVGTSRGNVHIRDVATGVVLGNAHVGGAVYSLALHPSLPILYASTTQRVIEIDTRTNDVQVLDAYDPSSRGYPQSLGVSPDGRELYIAYEGMYGKLRIWDIAIRAFVAEVALSESGGLGVAVSPDGAYVYVGSSIVHPGSVYVIDAARRSVIATIPVGGVPQRLAISPDGATLVVPNSSGWVDIVR